MGKKLPKMALDQVLKEFMEVYTEELDLKEKVKLLSEKRKELEEQVVHNMKENGISSVPCGSYTIYAKEKKTKKKPSKDAMLDEIAKNVGTTREKVKNAIDKFNEKSTVEIKTQLKPLKA